METLTQYGRMAERHWREFLPKLVAELEATGRLHSQLLKAHEYEDRLAALSRRQQEIADALDLTKSQASSQMATEEPDEGSTE